jgi:uncharacterized protein
LRKTTTPMSAASAGPAKCAMAGVPKASAGEQGYFGQKRTANVDTLSRARLLRFDDADQERICRRYPAIAARVFLNMNKIQAERRAEMQKLQR